MISSGEHLRISKEDMNNFEVLSYFQEETKPTETLNIICSNPADIRTRDLKTRQNGGVAISGCW